MSKSWDDIEDQGMVGKVINSKEFREAFQNQIKADTWDKGLPMVYMDDERWIVKHWKDGRIERISKVQ